MAFLVSTLSPAQDAKPVISLEPAAGRAVETFVKGEASFANAPANFRSFRSMQMHETGDAEALTLHFSAATKLTRIESTKDFKVEQGSSCVEGNVYAAEASCRLLVRFTPQGPGRRLGKVTISHTASATPFSLGLGGYGYGPVVSFTPAQISTVPASYPSNVGLLSGAQNLAVDGGDTLYVADTNNGVVRFMDSSAAFKTIASGYSGPTGITVDTFGEVYFSRPAANAINEVYDYGPVVQINGSGTGACTAATPCTLSSHTVTKPGELSMDNYNHMFFPEATSGAAFSTVQPVPANLIFLYDPFPFQTLPTSAAVMDASDNIYSVWANGGTCSIVMSTLYNAENSNVIFNKVAGGHTCGFAGDGGQARNAEIGSLIGQMAFDIMGNLYFTDSANQRVRRIDYTTGIINTIAGNGTAGNGGDGGAGTTASLNAPTGVAVDSQGQVYVISTTTGSAQLIRKLGVSGYLNFGGQLRGTASTGKTVTVSNTGNDTLTISGFSITGGNSGDFSIDPTTTSCLLTPGSTLFAGQSCKIGIIFKPAAAGTRGANLVILDNTVTNSNNVWLISAGTLPVPTIAITSPASGASFTAGTSIAFTATVTNATAPAPTGTVKFSLDGALLNGAVALSSGVATLNDAVSATGTHTLAVAYNGDANYSPTGSVTRTFTVTAAAVKKAATVTLSATNPATACKAVSFAATVAGPDAVKPTGTVTLREGTTVLATSTLSNGAATLTLVGLSAGTHSVTASYSGDSTHNAATSAVFKETVTGSGVCMTLHPMPVMPRRAPVLVAGPSNE